MGSAKNGQFEWEENVLIVYLLGRVATGQMSKKEEQYYFEIPAVEQVSCPLATNIAVDGFRKGPLKCDIC